MGFTWKPPPPRLSPSLPISGVWWGSPKVSSREDLKAKKSQLHSCEEADHICNRAPGHVGQQYILRTWVTCDGAALDIPAWWGARKCFLVPLVMAPLLLFYWSSDGNFKPWENIFSLWRALLVTWSLLPCSFAECICPGSGCREPAIPQALWEGVAHHGDGCVGQRGLASFSCGYAGLVFVGAGTWQAHLN